MPLIRMLKHPLAALLGITLLWTAPAKAAGTTPLALAVQADSSGNTVPGCLLYFFIAGTVASPQSAYADFGLSTPLPNPLQCDQAGRVPMHWLADGLIHIRLTDASGVQIIDTTMQVLGPSSGGGGGGGTTVDPTTLMATGDLKPRYGTGALSGFVRANGLTIGNVSSGATERASADTQALFVYLYTADPNLAVSGGRTGNALNDYNANKQITLPDWRGRALAALDDMGNAPAGRLTASYFGATATVLGQPGGGENVTLTAAQLPANIPFTDPGHTHAITGRIGVSSAFGTIALGGSADNGAYQGLAASTSTTGITINPSGGSAHRTVQPTMLATIYIKL